jgi:hypothetical protein
MTKHLALADWLEELAVYGTARRFQDAETAYHLSEAIKHWYLAALALRHCPIRGLPAPELHSVRPGATLQTL